MMKTEGYPESEVSVSADSSEVLIENGVLAGFFSMRMEKDRPYLVHFCVGRSFRTPQIARTLMKRFCERVRAMGKKEAILGIPINRPDLKLIMRYYFKKKIFQYAQLNGQQFFLTEV